LAGNNVLEASMSQEGEGRDQGVNIMTNMIGLDFVLFILALAD
jgi:hypothetical protein